MMEYTEAQRTNDSCQQETGRSAPDGNPKGEAAIRNGGWDGKGDSLR
jgi:hypothetical protein